MLYNPPAFREERSEPLFDLIDRHPFATLVTLGKAEGGEGELDVTALPLLHDPEPASPDQPPLGRLLGHMARGNGQWRRFQAAVPATAIFHGPEFYVTPAWYPTKQEHGRVVPTWNYELIVVTGHLSVTEEPEQLLALVTRLTERQEGRRRDAGRGDAWAVGDAPPDFVAAQLKGIVGLSLAIERIEGKRKMSQNRPADLAGVAAGLAAERADAPDLAAVLKAAQG